MKRFFVFLLIFPMFLHLLTGADDLYKTVERIKVDVDQPFNTSASSGKNNVDGQILRLEDVIRIEDTGGEFYFKYPSKVAVDSHDNVYILDSSRILQFDGKGNYLRDFLKKGEGPGEVKWVSDFCVTGDSVIAFNLRPSKIIRFTTGGEFVEEFRFDLQAYLTFVYSIGDSYFFLKNDLTGGLPGGYADVPHELLSISGKDKKITSLLSFPVKTYLLGGKSASGSFDIAEVHYVTAAERYLILSHTERYGVKIFDLTTGKMAREFSRKYREREIPSQLKEQYEKKAVTLNRTKYTMPPQAFLNDIRGLLVYKRNIWVVTSEVDEQKGVLIDVFDIAGKYIDAFYLWLGEQTDYYSPNWYIGGDFLYSIEQNPDDESLVVKYRLREKKSPTRRT